MRFAFLTSLHKLLLGLRPVAPNQGMGLLCLSHPYQQLWRILPALLTRSILPKIAGLNIRNAQEITLKLSSEWVLDGELFVPEGEVSLRVKIDRPIRFVAI